jgi:hypothetical protein
MAGFKNAGDRQLLWQDYVAQLIDRFFFVLSSRVLQLFDGIENLPEIPRRIDCQLVADVDLQFSGELNPKYGRIAFQIKLAELDEFFQRNHFLLFRRIDTAHQRREPPVLKFHDHRSLDIGSRRDDARRLVDFRFEGSPVAQHVFGSHENMRIELDHFLAQLAIEPGHDRNHEDQHRHPEHHAEHRNQCDDGEKRALRFQISQRQKKTKRQFQFGVSVAANPL